MISGAVMALGLWEHGFPLKQGSDDDKRQSISTKSQEKELFLLINKEEVMLRYFHTIV